MTELGDKVKIVRVCNHFDDEDENDQYGWAHDLVGVVKIISSDSRSNYGQQPYYVEFENPQKDWAREGLWCSDVEGVFDKVILPKELFEI